MALRPNLAPNGGVGMRMTDQYARSRLYAVDLAVDLYTIFASRLLDIYIYYHIKMLMNCSDLSVVQISPW